MNFTFDDEMITVALEANGYYTIWNDDNWAHKESLDPDHSGQTKQRAFERLLYELNLTPRNVDKCWRIEG
jgi:hypothetical protein